MTDTLTNACHSAKPQAKEEKIEFVEPDDGLLLTRRTAFWVVAFCHMFSALFAPIQDCDEVYNYWEPLHFFTHGKGFETWEYSPQFGVRSWAYVVLHSLPTKMATVIGMSKPNQFYMLRLTFALISAAAESNLFSQISKTLNHRIAIFYLMIVSFTPGFFYASTAFLPASFAMITTTLALGAFMSLRGGAKTETGIFWFAVGAMLGWPFAGVLITTFVLEDWVVALLSNEPESTFRNYVSGAMRFLPVLLAQIGVDSYYYGKLIFVPWQIVKYNVFGGQGRGPELFGTEPVDFYFKNLLLNFNIWFVLAICIAPLLCIQWMFFKEQTSTQTIIRTFIFTTPFYLWLAIFSAQAHKEERFMYPVYPFLALNASLSFYKLLGWFGVSNPRTFIGRLSQQTKFTVIITFMFVFLGMGFLRILGTTTAYQAPMQIYQGLEQGVATPGDTVCLGKDWYRYPSTFFVPDGVHVKFVASEFHGLLPGNFTATSNIPSGMNDMNQEDTGKHVDIKQCTFMIDSHFPSTHTTSLEPKYIDSPEWERVKCAPFLDAASTGLIGRALWVPDMPFVPESLRRVWGQHCLLKQRA